MGVTSNNESTTTEPPPKDGHQPKPLGTLKCVLLVPNLLLKSSHGGFLTVAIQNLLVPVIDWMRVWMRGGGGGSGFHYSLKIKPVIYLIKFLGYFIKIRPIIH